MKEPNTDGEFTLTHAQSSLPVTVSVAYWGGRGRGRREDLRVRFRGDARSYTVAEVTRQGYGGWTMTPECAEQRARDKEKLRGEVCKTVLEMMGFDTLGMPDKALCEYDRLLGMLPKLRKLLK